MREGQVSIERDVGMPVTKMQWDGGEGLPFQGLLWPLNVDIDSSEVMEIKAAGGLEGWCCAKTQE